MKPTLLIILIALLLCSCSQFQYLTVSGVNVIKDSSNELVAENDTLQVRYRFADYGGKVAITIFNKTVQPVEVDWRRSAIVVDGKTFSYYNPNAGFSGRIDTLARSSIANPLYIAEVNGSIAIDQATGFIPPHASIQKIPLNLLREPLQNLPAKAALKETLPSTDDEPISYKRMDFQTRTSPLTFRSYLTLKIGTGAAAKEFAVEHQFYISEVWQSGSGPQSFPEKLVNRGDRFYLTP